MEVVAEGNAPDVVRAVADLLAGKAAELVVGVVDGAEGVAVQLAAAGRQSAPGVVLVPDLQTMCLIQRARVRLLARNDVPCESFSSAVFASDGTLSVRLDTKEDDFKSK